MFTCKAVADAIAVQKVFVNHCGDTAKHVAGAACSTSYLHDYAGTVVTRKSGDDCALPTPNASTGNTTKARAVQNTDLPK